MQWLLVAGEFIEVFIGVHAPCTFSIKYRKTSNKMTHCSEVLRIVVITLISSSFSSLNGLAKHKESLQCNECNVFARVKREHANTSTAAFKCNKFSSDFHCFHRIFFRKQSHCWHVFIWYRNVTNWHPTFSTTTTKMCVTHSDCISFLCMLIHNREIRTALLVARTPFWMCV